MLNVSFGRLQDKRFLSRDEKTIETLFQNLITTETKIEKINSTVSSFAKEGEFSSTFV